jgi:hypothetical protein
MRKVIGVAISDKIRDNIRDKIRDNIRDNIRLNLVIVDFDKNANLVNLVNIVSMSESESLDKHKKII